MVILRRFASCFQQLWLLLTTISGSKNPFTNYRYPKFQALERYQYGVNEVVTINGYCNVFNGYE
jgi:hypothetical protein